MRSDARSRTTPDEERTTAHDSDDRELVEQARAGDDDAFRALVARHDGVLLALASRLLGDRDEADDLRQQAWWRIWRALGDFDGRAGFATWAYRIVLNLCRDQRRSHARRRALSAAPGGGHHDARLAELADSALEPEEQLLRRERATEVRAALAALPDDERECLVLRHYHDLAPGAIAAVVGRPRTTVQSCLARALLRLQLRLRAQLPGDSDDAPSSGTAETEGGR